MNVYRKFLVSGLLIFFAGCATQIDLPKTVKYDYNINFDFTTVKTYDLSPTPTTVGIEYLMLERIKSAIYTELDAKNLKQVSSNPDFLVAIFGARSKIFTTIWRGFDSGLIVEKGKLILQFVDPETHRIIWWGEASAILDPDSDPVEETKMVNDVVHRILQMFPPATL
jgi:hypothetical protein